MGLSAKSLAGPGYIILNVVRVMNIIALLAVACASVVMLVKTFNASKFFFFDGCSHVITTFVSFFLVFSEVSLFRGYFARNWPLLSPSHGFVFLGSAMIILGINILGNLNKSATSAESLGLAFWRIVIGSGIVVFAMGFFNIFTSYIFRDRSQGVTARMVRAHGATAAEEQHGSPVMTNTYAGKTPVLPSPTKAAMSAFSPFKRMKRCSSLPSYYSQDPSNSSPKKGGKDSKRTSLGPKLPLNISAPMNPNHNFTHLVKPAPTHPADRTEPEVPAEPLYEPFHWRTKRNSGENVI
ncbi:MAG: hypothetical protein M1820_000385 [Bogoriella megaspora]|nr:MAG: hypothetical protein M1820_000385 [Bogoriella megaspora]